MAMQEGIDADHRTRNAAEACAGAPPEGCTTKPGQRRQAATQASDRASEGTELCAPREEVEEEERLRAAREEAESKESARGGAGTGQALTLDRFQALESLLNKSQLYTQFLAENMASAESEQLALEEEQHKRGAGELDGDDVVPGKGSKSKTKAGTKRKAPVRGAAAAAATRGKAAKRASASVPGDGTVQSETDAAEKTRLAVRELCPGLVADLRDYQLRGVRWLASLFVNGINGILADQMGLGKTVQTIGMLCHLRGKGIRGPYLVLGPLSTLHNWVAEFERWAPDFPCILYHGTKAERAALWSRHLASARDGELPAVVTSYEILLADIRSFLRLRWKYLVVDEGHRLKNHNCRLFRELRTLAVDNKLLLTGTPLQNNLAELWSLLNFILPEAFSSLADFEAWFEGMAEAAAGPGDELEDQTRAIVGKLHAILKPFLLRRVKTDVETSLPGKLEIVLYAPLSAKQRQLNDQLRAGTLREGLAKQAGGPPTAASMTSLNNMLMQLRKNCNHPDLITSAFDGSVFYPPPEQLVEECGKLALLERVLDRLLPAGHKVLVFSQMTAMLDILASYLEARGISHCRLDGSVSWQERQEAVATFNSDPAYKVFLLSTRAGGLGINLTAADTCVLYDSDWNPQQDLQAMDRCHRIGQHNPVLVLRLASAHSVEGRLLARARAKLQLERLVIKNGAFLHADDDSKRAGAGSLSKEELLDVLSLGATGDGDGAGATAADGHATSDPAALVQSGAVDDATLEQLLDRSHLVTPGLKRPYSDTGVGYEVVHQLSGSGLLAGVE